MNIRTNRFFHFLFSSVITVILVYINTHGLITTVMINRHLKIIQFIIILLDINVTKINYTIYNFDFLL